MLNLWRWFGCRHTHVLYDRVNGVPCWRCFSCGCVRERLVK